MSFALMPQELVQEILLCLDPIHLIRFASTCHKIACVLDSDFFWQCLCQRASVMDGQTFKTLPEHLHSYKDWFIHKTNTKLTLLDDFTTRPWFPQVNFVHATSNLNYRFGPLLKMECRLILFQGNWDVFLRYQGPHDLDVRIEVLVNHQLFCIELVSLRKDECEKRQPTLLTSFQIMHSHGLVHIQLMELEKRCWIDWSQDIIQLRRSSKP